MIDRERILGVLNDLDGYLEELNEAMPASLEEYLASSEKRRACERLLQISIECVIDISLLLVRGLRLGTPADEEDALAKLERKKIISKDLFTRLKGMKGFRNVLVHRYAQINDEKAYDALEKNLGDFEEFREVVLGIIKKKKEM